MRSKNCPRFSESPTAGLPMLLAGLVLALAGPAIAQVLPFELVVDESRVELGDDVQIIVRTVESRALASASFGLEVRDRNGFPATAFASLESATVFAGTAGGSGDATIDAQFDPVTQRVDVTVASPTATLNELFGPLAVLHFTLAPGVQLGDRFEIPMDPDTVVVDALAAPVTTLVSRGRLRIIAVDPAQALGALGGEVFLGGEMVIGAMTVRPYAIGGGTIEVLYDASLADGPAVVSLDPRYGLAVIDSLTEPQPGQIIVTFHSDGAVYNSTLHGAILTVVMPSRADIPAGTLSTVSLGPATALTDAAGDPIVLEMDNEVINFLAQEFVARAGFNAGNFVEFFHFVQ